MYKVGNVFVTDRDPNVEHVVTEVVLSDDDGITYSTSILAGSKYERQNAKPSFCNRTGQDNILVDNREREVTCTVIAQMDISFVHYRRILTEEQKQRYLDTNGTECPFCRQHIDHYVTDDIELSGSDEAYQSVKCPECNATWREFFDVELKMSYITDL